MTSESNISERAVQRQAFADWGRRLGSWDANGEAWAFRQRHVTAARVRHYGN
jgi:hypothetical protein